MSTPKFGMRGTGTFSADERPKNWRQMILHQFPFDAGILNAIISKTGKEESSDPEFNWFSKTLPTLSQEFTSGEIYTNTSATTAYVSGAVDGSVLYIRAAKEFDTQIRLRHELLIADGGNPSNATSAEIISKSINGADVIIGVELSEAPKGDLLEANVIEIIGDSNPEGAEMPENISYDPRKFSNFTQIFRTPLSITRTAKKTKLRTRDKYLQMKDEALLLHGIFMERALINGPKKEKVVGGHPQRKSGGIRWMLEEYYPENIADFSVDAEYNAKTWKSAGRDFLDNRLEISSRNGKGTPLLLAGSKALLGLSNLVNGVGQYSLGDFNGGYGINVKSLITPFGEFPLALHPLLSHTPLFRNSIFITYPENIIFRYVDDTVFKSDDDAETKNRNNSKDATEEEFLTEAGYEIHFLNSFQILHGIGKDNL